MLAESKDKAENRTEPGVYPYKSGSPHDLWLKNKESNPF